MLGVGMGVFFGWAVGELVDALGVSTWTLVLPWGRLALTLAAAALVGVIAALWPARRAAKLNMLEAIKAAGCQPGAGCIRLRPPRWCARSHRRR